jgi:hypothetical protein
MTGSNRRGDTPMEPPWPLDVLADLHAGVSDDATSLLPRARQDPDARAVLDALDATRAELSGLGQRPVPPMPDRFAARLEAAIAAEARAMFPAPRQPMRLPHVPQQPMAPVADLAAARARRNKRIGWGAGALVAAAAAAVVVIAIPKGGSPLQGVAAPPPTTSDGAGATATGPQSFTHATLPLALAAALGSDGYGPLADPARRAACLAANGQDPNRVPAGAMQVILDGKPGTLMVLTTGVTAQYRLLVVGRDCAAGTPDQLADTVVGGITPTTR